jgi:glycosyltransferase involved in cell wall biosynthesis
MKRLRIALCITELDLGGAERCLTELACRVDRRRFEPVVYCLGPRPRDCPDFRGHGEAGSVENGTVPFRASCLPALEAAGVEVHCLGGRGIWQFPLIVGRLRRLIAAQKPHIAQTFLFHANVLGRIAARRAGVKAVLSGIRVAEHKSHWHLWLDRGTEAWVDRYVCVSRSVADFTATKGGIPKDKIVVIPNGIDLEQYPANKKADLRTLGVPVGRRVILFVGRLAPQKGVPWLLEMVPSWLEKLPDCDLLLVGEGPLRKSFEADCCAAGIANRVHFAGWRSDVPEILAAADLLVLPSAWEGMPNVVLEAMASRRPVVASAVEGVQELLGTWADRQMVRYVDTQGFCDKVVGLMQNHSQAALIGEENRRWAEKNFGISQMVAAYETLWESLATD